MAVYTQANRPIRVDTVLDTDLLLLNGFNGLEGVSQLYSFQLDLLSIDPGIDPLALLRTPALLTLNIGFAEQRYFHGIIRRIAQHGRRDDLTYYTVEMVPWFFFLRLSRESRIYQEKTAPEIIEDTFNRLGYQDYELRLTREYTQRWYCVQYRETHFDFVCRLMEEEGIYYFFKHEQDKHVLVLCDNNGRTEPAPDDAARFSDDSSEMEQVVWEFEREHAVHPTKITIWDYDYLQPNLQLATTLGSDNGEEVYDYPGHYASLAEGEWLARLLLEAREVEHQQVRGAGDVRGFVPGHHFTLSNHYRADANGEYLLTQVQHYANAGEFRAWDHTAELTYENHFQCIPLDVPYRAPQRTPRPMIHGTQPAIVVGPAGEEVYTDSHARVKVQFYWDREGQRDEKSSCWIRVATPWGGKGYGGVSLPRIGNEVIVAFEEGDPDRPIIIGSVYNADQTPPFELPGAGIQMGMKSRSSPGGGGHNEMTMTDTKGKELMNIHAQYDMMTVVEHDDTQHIKNDRTITVDGTHTETIDKDTTITIKTGNLSETVSAGTQTTTVNKDIKIKSETTLIHITAATEIKLEVGSSSLLMKSDGTINLKGVNVSVEGKQGGAVAVSADTTVEAKGLTVMLKGDATVSIEAPQVMSDGTATNIVKGGMVMLNP